MKYNLKLKNTFQLFVKINNEEHEEFKSELKKKKKFGNEASRLFTNTLCICVF